MNNRIITIPDLVRQKVVNLGAEGQRWLDSLPDLVAELEQEWQMTVKASLSGGSEAYVAKATTNANAKVVLKIAMPPTDGNTVFVNEVTALTIAAGRGYAQLLRSDLDRRALLIEQLGVPLNALGYSSQTQIDLICATLQESWVQPPPGASLMTGAEMGQWFLPFITNLWEQLNHPCSPQTVDLARAFAESRAKAFDPNNAVLVHGDAHGGNILQNLSQTAFKLIDPDGIFAEPAYDLGVLMRDWTDELIIDPVRLGQERCTYLNRLTGAGEQAIWQWGFIQTVATGLLLLHIGQKEEGSQMLKVAEAWLKKY